MAENRCSMCGKSNAAEADVCAQCGARLTPVRPPSRPGNAGKFTGGLSWLDAFREETGASDEESASFESGFSSYEEEPPSPSNEQPSGSDDAPDWLQRIRDRNDADRTSFTPESEDEIRVDERSLNLGAEEEDEDVPDWLRNLKEQEPPAVQREEAQQIPSWQDAMSTWNSDGAVYEEEEQSGSGFEEGEPKVTEWFNRILPGDEEKSQPAKQTFHFDQEPQVPQGFQSYEANQEPETESGFDEAEPDVDMFFPQGFVTDADEVVAKTPFEGKFSTKKHEVETYYPKDYEPDESEESDFPSGFVSSEVKEESSFGDDSEFMAQFKDYEHPSGFSEEDVAAAEGDDLQYEDWESRSANLYSVTESKNASEDVPSWLQEDGDGSQEDSAQSVLNWLDELDQQEGTKQKARYWMGEIDTGELPPDKASNIRYKEPEKKESVYDPFAFDDESKPGATQFFSEDELDDDAPIKTPAHTMLFNQEDEEDDDVPGWLSGQSAENEYEKKPTQTVGLSGLDESAFGTGLQDEQPSPWDMASFDDEPQQPPIPGTPKMTAALTDLDAEDLEEDEELPPWLSVSSTTPTEPRNRTPIMTAELGDLDEEDAQEEEETPPWLRPEGTVQSPPTPRTPIMTAALPGLDDEDLGMDLPDDEIPPWLRQAQEEPQEEYPKTPIMTAALDDLDDEEPDVAAPWLQEPRQPVQGRKPSLMTAALTGLEDQDLESEEVPPWIQDIEPADVHKAPSQPLMTAELPDLGGEGDEDELPPWMQEVDRVYDEQPSQPLKVAELSNWDGFEADEEEETPPWMQDVEEVVPPAKRAPMMTAALTGLDDEEFASEETPAWMRDIEEVAPPPKGTPTMTAALSGLDDEDFQSEETPAWMQDLEEIAPPTGTPVMTAALPDLDQDGPVMPPPKAPPAPPEEDEIPDWMRTVEETRQLGRLPGQPPAGQPYPPPQQGQKSPFTVGLTGDADDKDQSIDEMFSDDLLTTGKLNEMVGIPTPESKPAPEDQSIDEMFSDQLLSTGRLNAMTGTPEAPVIQDQDQSIDEMFSDQLLTTGKLNAMVGVPGMSDATPTAEDEEQSVDEMFSDQLLTTGKLNALVGTPGMSSATHAVDDEEQSVDEMFSDQLLTTGKLNALVGIPGIPAGAQEADDGDLSVDELFSDQLLTTGRLNAMSGIPADMPPSTPANTPFVTDENESVDEMFSDQLLTTGMLNQMHVQDQSKDGLSIDEAYSDELFNTGKLRDLSSGLEKTQALPSQSSTSETPLGDDWLAEFGASGSDESDMLVGASLADEEEASVKSLPSGEVPDWLAELEPEDEKIHATENPAFTFEAEPEPPAKLADSHPFEGDDLPNWLSPEVWQSDGKQGSGPAASSDGGVANIQWELEGLEKGELPSWLQQIKPDQLVTRRSNRALTSDQLDEQSEKVGPLAGLSGVLPAQDMVMMYRKPPVYSDQLSLSERQSNRMQVLSRMMDSEAKNKTLKVGDEKVPLNTMRIIFAIVLVLIMLIPLSGLIPITGGLPYSVSDPVVAFYNQVEQFPENSSVLLVMDFESGYTAEMRSSLDGLMMRLYEKNMDVAMISTLPTGPVIAEQIAQETWWNYYAAHPETNVLDYESRVLNMGYLPGGSAAMLQFVRYPRQSIQYGFGYEKNPTPVWSTQVLSDIYSINDFSGVVVVTDSANVSRNWIEQSTLQSLNNILFITSAQTYPLILPYWQSGQVKGLIAGVYQGYTYRSILNQSAGLAPKWYSYQFGMNLVTILAILLTVIYIIRNAIPRRKTTR